MPQVRALSPRPKLQIWPLGWVWSFYFCRARTWEGPQRKRQSCGLFLARSVQSGTEGTALGRQACSMRSRRSSPVTSTKNDRFLRLKTSKNGHFFVMLHKFWELSNFLTNYLTTYFRPKIAPFSPLMITPNWQIDCRFDLKHNFIGSSDFWA